MASDYILRTRDLSKDFKGFTAVNRVSLNVRRGTIHALIGPNGAGKTTCFNLITKFLQPSAGSIFYKERDITRAAPHAVARMGLVRSFQISAVFPRLSVLENVRLAVQQKQGMSYRLWRSESALEVLNERALELLESVGIGAFAELSAAELPYGRKRALEIATTLALDPDVMLLDEPMAGLSTEDIRRTSDLIRRVAENRTVLMVEHNLSVVAELSDRITVLARGEVLAEGSYAEVSRDPHVVAAYMGTGGDADH